MAEENFGERLRKKREGLNLSQTELAQKIGVNQSTIVRWENGTLSPSINIAASLARILGCPLGDLVEGG